MSPADKDVQAIDILRLALGMTREQHDKAAHALGWRDTANVICFRGLGRIKLRNPFRNYYCCEASDPDWIAMQAAGLAGRGPDLKGWTSEQDCYWRLTPIGVAVTRARLLAVRDAEILRRSP